MFTYTYLQTLIFIERRELESANLMGYTENYKFIDRYINRKGYY